MTLSFTLEDGLYVAEFEATSRFNLHLERPASGSIYMKQKTVKDGSYVIVKDFGWNRDGDLIIDADCGQGAVYPKWIRLESAVEPSVAEVTFESESSGGGAGTESVSKYIKGIEYYAVNYDKLVELGYDSSDMSVTTPSGMLNQALIPACGGKIFRNGLSLVLGPGMFDLYRGFFNAPIIGIYYINVLQQTVEDSLTWFAPTFKEAITGQPIGGVFNEAFTEITEEQFYSLEA